MNDNTLNTAKKREKTELILSNIYNLPAMPKVMLEVYSLLEKPNLSAIELSKVIGQDQALVSKILTIANSPLYGLPRKVSTIDFAILIIGFNDIKNIVTALSLIDTFKNKTDSNLNQMDFWIHSIVAGSSAKRIAEDLGYKIAGEAFVTGLLHDLGIPVIHKYFHSSFVEIREKAAASEKSFMQIEKEVLGMTHEEIGRFLIKKWNLPIGLVDALGNHHNPSNSREDVILTSLIHLADYMTNYFVNRDFYWDKGLQLHPKLYETLRFSTEKHLLNFIENYKDLCSIQAELLKGLV